MKLRSLKTLLALADNNCDFSIHKVLCVPRSTLWSHISEIESELNIKLVNRRKQHSTFTDEGIAFIPYARKIYDIYSEGLVNVSSNKKQGIRGDILISTTRALADGWLLPSLGVFYEKYDDIHVKIIADDRLDNKVINSADVFIRPMGDLENVSKFWGIDYEHGLFASQNYLDNMGVPKVGTDLLKHKILSYGQYEFSFFGDINWHLSGKHEGLPKLVPSLSINSTSAIYKAAYEGLGICSTPVESNRVYMGGLVRVLPEITGPKVSTYFCVRDGLAQHKSETIRLFQNFFEDYITQQGVHVKLVQKA